MSEESRTTEQEAPAEDAFGESPLRKWAPVTLAAIVLLGAVLAILQTDASTNEANTARETTRTAVGALRAGVIDRAALGVQEQFRAEKDALEFRSPLSGGRAADLERARGRLPEPRPALLDELRFEAERLGLKQAALTETRVTWNDRSTQYTTVIAVLAVALFLVGFSVVVRGPLRRSFYLLGVVVAFFVVAWAAWIYQLSIPETPDAAIEQAARGTVELRNDRPARAARAFDRAVEIDPDYGPAYAGRSAAGVEVANPDIFTTGAVTDATEAPARALDDAERALDLSDGRDPVALGLLALAAFYGGDYARAIATADQILDVNDRAVAALLLRSAAQVAGGDGDGAEASLDRAAELLAGVTASLAVREFARDYLTYLEWVAHAEPDRADAAAALATRVIGAETALALGLEITGTRPERGDAEVIGLRFADGRLQGRIQVREVPGGTAVTALGFERPTTGGPWVQPAELAVFRTVGGDETNGFSVPITRNCAPTEVQVRIYLDGALVETATGAGAPATC